MIMEPFSTPGGIMEVTKIKKLDLLSLHYFRKRYKINIVIKGEMRAKMLKKLYSNNKGV